MPKQFCSLRGGRSLLGDALGRALRVAPRERIVVVLTEHHRRHWQGEELDLPPENVLVQPCNRGTGPGLALPLVEIAARDPRAVVAVLPSDHHVADEDVFAGALQRALRRARTRYRGAILLGIAPDAPETEYGWILPAGRGAAFERVSAFVEKPRADVAERLRRAGALWNSFVMAARATALLDLHRSVAPGLVDAFLAWRGTAPEVRERAPTGRRLAARSTVPRRPDALAARGAGDRRPAALAAGDRLHRALAARDRLHGAHAAGDLLRERARGAEAAGELPRPSRELGERRGSPAPLRAVPPPCPGLRELYERIATSDFSREVLGAARDLAVFPVPRCGWTDLGTPRRVAECLRGLPGGDAPPAGGAILVLSDRLPRNASA